MAIKIYIVEDNPAQREKLEQAIKDYQLFSDWELELAYSTGSGEALLRNIDRSNQWNIYFLDINLEESDEVNNGFIVAQKIRAFDPFGFIIFVTIRSELSFLTFQYRVQALDFIIKDPSVDIRERLYSCLRTVKQRLDLLSQSQTMRLNTGNEIMTFLVEDILYFSSNKGHILTMVTRQNDYMIYQETLNELETKLSEHFLRCHRGFLINTKAITHIAKVFGTVVLEDGSSIPVSVRKRSALKALKSNLVLDSLS
ncbi:DNA-binding response regulator [Enterococcus florum]|uniref:DNA-binding response regulator n=1 Tax=Enterococcus florum TaxID=2480627 RepID=A0A4P5P8F0_9ENTE|nr:LytTR family DNA-binding domain-containing protein [Enterococcus florum]GCF93806.1 DNA-binding response regulator [Enterococcus florum]